LNLAETSVVKSRLSVPHRANGIVCMILRLAILVQCRLVTDRHTHDDSTYQASIVSHGKNGPFSREHTSSY